MGACDILTRCRGIADESAPTEDSGCKKKAGDMPALFLHPRRRSAIHPMALAGRVIVTMVVGHARVVADLVTMVRRRMVGIRMMVVGIGGQRRHERGAHHE
jgi:hypothetical protein